MGGSQYILTKVRARTLFATHFHELTGLAHRARGESLHGCARPGRGDRVPETRKEGPSNNSYGIHVARLAGLPAETLAYAEKMLDDLKPGTAVMGSQVPQGGPPQGQKPPARPQRRLFSSEELIAREIMSLVPDRMTPLEALSAITRWKNELAKEKTD